MMVKKTKEMSRSEILRKSKQKRIFKDNLTLFMLVLPGLICLIVFSYIPMGGIVIAFKNYIPRKGIFGSPWVGLDNFEFLFRSPDILKLIRNTALYGSAFLILDLITQMGLALLFYFMRAKKAQAVYKTIFQLPRFLSIIVVSYVTYALLSPSYGILNQVIISFGGTAVSWYQEPAYWPFILSIVHIWMCVGGGCLLYYSNLLSIDPALFEAAVIDGATTLQKCRYIALPSFKPLVAMNLTLGVGALISVDMGLFDAIPRAQGLLFPTTDVINTYVYRGVLRGDISMPAAVGLFQSLVALFLILLANAIIKKVSPENSML